MTKAKLFMTGGSQAVRLPAEFRFEGDEVDIRRDSTTGDVVLSKPMASWEEYFDWVRTLELPRDFLEDRNQPEDDLCLTRCHGAGVADPLLDTEIASRLMRRRAQGRNRPAPIGRSVGIDFKHHHGGAALWRAPSRRPSHPLRPIEGPWAQGQR